MSIAETVGLGALVVGVALIGSSLVGVNFAGGVLIGAGMAMVVCGLVIIRQRHRQQGGQDNGGR